MNRQTAMEDLITLREFFKESSGGSVPMCLDYAISILRDYQWNTGEPQEVNKQYLVQDKDGRKAVGTFSNFGWVFGHYMNDPVAWMELPEDYEEYCESCMIGDYDCKEGGSDNG